MTFGNRHRHDNYPARALGGLITTLAGLLLAISLIPEHPQVEGALLLHGLVFSIFILAVPFVSSLNGFAAALRAENILAVGIVYWLLADLILSTYPMYGVIRESIVGSFVAIGLMLLGMWLGTATRPWKMPGIVQWASDIELGSATCFRLVLLFFALGIFKYLHAVDFSVTAMFENLGVSRWQAPWARGQLGGWDAFIDHMKYFGFVVPSLTVVLGIKRGWFKPDVAIAIILSLVMVAMLSQTGGRRIVGVSVGSAIVCWALLQTRIRLRSIAIVSLFVVVTLWFMQFMLTYRGIGYQAAFQNDVAVEKRGQLRIDDNFLRLSQVIQIVPEAHPYVHEKLLIFTLVRPIPRVFWPGKPVSPGFDLAQFLGKRGVSLSISVVGELYLIWGWISIFVGGYFFGRLASMWSGLLRSATTGASKPLIYGLGLMSLFAGLRSLQDLVIMSYAWLAWCGVAWMVLTKSKKISFSYSRSKPENLSKRQDL